MTRYHVRLNRRGGRWETPARSGGERVKNRHEGKMGMSDVDDIAEKGQPWVVERRKREKKSRISNSTRDTFVRNLHR